MINGLKNINIIGDVNFNEGDIMSCRLIADKDKKKLHVTVLLNDKLYLTNKKIKLMVNGVIVFDGVISCFRTDKNKGDMTFFAHSKQSDNKKYAHKITERDILIKRDHVLIDSKLVIDSVFKVDEFLQSKNKKAAFFLLYKEVIAVGETIIATLNNKKINGVVDFVVCDFEVSEAITAFVMSVDK